MKTGLKILFFLFLLVYSGISAAAAELPSQSDTVEPSSTEINTEQATTQTNSLSTKKKKNQTIKITISAAGDCTLGIDPTINHSFDTYYQKYGSAYFFKKVKKIFSKDDVTIVNFEGTLTTSKNRAPKKYAFKGPDSYARILTKGSVEVVNLANNHSMDYGTAAFDNTKKVLKKNHIQYCHYGTIAYKKVNGVKIAFLGFSQINGVTNEQVKHTIQTAKKHKAKIIIVSFHWGIEREYYPNSTQKSLAHSAIDNGASLVLGHHPHVLQGVEKYKNCYIVYSLGNFCFGGNMNPADKDTMIFQQTFYVKNGKLLKKRDTRILPCSLSGSSYTNDYQPRLLTGSSKKRLIEKINRLSKDMKVQFDANGKPKK
ncbi:MAG: CapA family protein [Lachnospiraceae bacterium]